MKASARMVNSTSATRSTSACSLLWKHTSPSAPISANATFGSTDPTEEFTLLTAGNSTTSDDVNAP
ncbi:MAG: hypothetical protein R2697_12805 [Ilumatobacteraceae bacterium]